MRCNRCAFVPELIFNQTDVYINLPTHHHAEVLENALKQKQVNFERLDAGYMVRKVDFETLMTYLETCVFNSVEQKDVKILPLQEGSLTFSALRNYRSLSVWTSQLQGKEVSSIIENERIRTLFQPIIEANTGAIHGYEALSRGIKQDGTYMNPEKLFSMAKSMDLLFFLDRVCRESSLKSASKQGITSKLFINFIPTAIYEPSLCLQTTENVLHEENLRTDQVVFEVVETEKVEDFGHLNHILNYYRSKGYSTALDDIGSGYSDLSSLIKLKPDYMKIDMEIIRDIHKQPKKQTILATFVKHGKAIGLKILAEGIETEEEYDYLKRNGVDLMQGYLFGKPEEVPVKTIDFQNW